MDSASSASEYQSVGINRHQRRVRKALVEILDDNARVIKRQITVDQCRHGVIRIEIHEVLGKFTTLDVHNLDVDVLLGKHQSRPMAVDVGRSRKQSHY
jgi:hypothetical protein